MPSARTAVVLVALTLVAGGTATVTSPSASADGSDPCDVSPVLAVPAACAAGARLVEPRSGSADVAIPAGNAFADGMSNNPGLSANKLTFLPGSMGGAQVVKAEAVGSSVFGYDFTPDGSLLYGVDNATSSLFTVNQTTGDQTVVGPMSLPANSAWTDISIDPVTGAAFAISVANAATSFSLFHLDLATGATTLVQSVSSTAVPIDASINCAGVMYAETAGTDQLATVDRATGALTSVGPIGFDLKFAQGMDFDNATGILHAWQTLASATTQYATVNTATGASTVLPGSVAGEFEGAIKTTCPAPTATVTSGPGGRTADTRPTFGFTTTHATTVQCSVDTGTAAFAACPGATFQPASDLTPGSYTFRVKATGAAAQTADATRAFTVVDCATLRTNVTKATAKAAKAKAKVKKAKKTGNPVKIKRAKAKLKKAKAALKAAKAALAAEPVCA